MGFVETFAAAKEEGRSAFLPYMMSGLPTPETSIDLFAAMADAGADAFEIGIPYADPLMDGPVIQAAGERALASGVTLAIGLDLTAQVIETTNRPCAVMTYVNPVLALGPEAFARRAADAGASAVIVADLPIDESPPFSEVFAAAGVGLVQFAAPTTTDERLARVVEAADPFVYGIAEMGVTGERDGSTSRAAALAERIRNLSSVPLVLGVGISGPAQASDAAGLADGVIVGSALVRRVLDADGPGAAIGQVAEVVGTLAAAVRRSG